MKIIFALIIVMFSLQLNGQSHYSVVVDSFFNFKFDKSLSASESLNNKEFIELPGHVGKTDIVLNEISKTITMEFDTMSYTLNMLGHPNGNKDAYVYEYKDGDKMVRGQMSFVYSSTGEKYLVSEGKDIENPNYQIAWVAKIIKFEDYGK
jgi:hypothetical protein